MSTKQGDISLLQEPLAQQLLQSKGPAHLAYNWRDGTPRVIPIGFHWNGEELVMATATDAPKTKVLTDGTKVAVTIDQDFSASKMLLIRGTVHVDIVDGLAPEFISMMYRTMSKEDAEASLEGSACLYPRMTRIFIYPDWVGILDFETRLPSAIEHIIEQG